MEHHHRPFWLPYRSAATWRALLDWLRRLARWLVDRDPAADRLVPPRSLRGRLRLAIELALPARLSPAVRLDRWRRRRNRDRTGALNTFLGDDPEDRPRVVDLTADDWRWIHRHAPPPAPGDLGLATTCLQGAQEAVTAERRWAALEALAGRAPELATYELQRRDSHRLPPLMPDVALRLAAHPDPALREAATRLRDESRRAPLGHW